MQDPENWRTSYRIRLFGKKVKTARSVRERIKLIKKHPQLSEHKPCKLLGVARSTAYYKPVEDDKEDIKIKRLLDKTYMMDPSLGSRKIVTILKRDHGIAVNRKRIRRLRREIGVYQNYCGNS